jgi:hypothetical protein
LAWGCGGGAFFSKLKQRLALTRYDRCLGRENAAPETRMSAISSVSQFLPVTPPAPVAPSRQSAPPPPSRDEAAKEASKPASASKAPGTGTIVDIKA